MKRIRQRATREASLPSLQRLLTLFEEREEDQRKAELEAACTSKLLSRTAFYKNAEWAILVSGVSIQAAETNYRNAVECGFPEDWMSLGKWGDDEFDAWCKKMAGSLSTPQNDLSETFRNKWWAIWDLAWYLSQFEDEEAFRSRFFDGKMNGKELTDEDVRRLKVIKEEEDRLFMIGVANRYFVLRNLGGDFLKPDVWIEEFCRWYGDVSVSELARKLKNEGIHCGRFDAYCWSYCEREIGQSKYLASHFNEILGLSGTSNLGDASHQEANSDIASLEEVGVAD